jgi:hypothetical protein
VITWTIIACNCIISNTQNDTGLITNFVELVKKYEVFKADFKSLFEDKTEQQKASQKT